MKTLIVYCSSHGTTGKAAHMLRKHIEGEVVVLNLNQTKLQSDLQIFDSVIIGGSIHAGNIQSKVKKFIKENHEVLLTRNIGLFLCCMREGEIASEQFENAFPAELRERAIATGIFGGEFLVSKMNFFEKLIVKKVSGVTEDTSKIDVQSIEDFAKAFNSRQVVPV